jgi:predicted small secreted protein
MRSSTPHLFQLLLASTLAAACSTVWGFEDGTPVPAAGGSAGAGAESSGGHSSGGEAGTGPGGSAGQGTGGSCESGQTEDLGACGNCGTLRRACSADGLWEAPACTDEGECEPGTTSTPVGCGLCGEQVSTCSEACAWGPLGACTGEGVCTPGTRRDCMCSTDVTTHCCGDEVCNDQCQWNACAYKAGAECDWQAGYNWSCCTTAGQRHWCLSSCVWSTTCVAYAGC